MTDPRSKAPSVSARVHGWNACLRVWQGAVLSLLACTVLLISCTSISDPAGARAPAEADLSGAPNQPATPIDPHAYYHFMLGYRAEMTQDSERAIREYTAALGGDSSSAFLQARLASTYFSVGDVTNAVGLADRVAGAEVRDASLLVMVAGIYAGAGQLDKALALYDRAIVLDPTKSDPYFSKGILLVNLKRYDEAERAFESGIQHAGQSPVGYYYLGRIGVESKQPHRAIENFERAIAVNPTFEPAYVALATVYESQQDRGKAAAVYRRYLLQVDPRSREIRQHLIRLYLVDKSYREALAELDVILAEDPSDLDAQLRAGLIHGELKDYPKAIEKLKAILAARPGEVRVRDYLGLMYEESKDYDSALRAYEANLKLQPTYVDAHMHMGFLLYRLKRYPEAIAHLTEAVRLNPKQSDAHLLLGLTYLQTEQYILASQAFEEGIRHHPANPDLHFNLGTAYDKLNRFDDVVRAMETALRLDPKHADALNYLGYTYAERGIKIEEAVSLTKQAVSLKPNNGYYVDSLGWAFFKMGLLDEALVEIMRATSLVRDDPVIFEHLGEIYLKQNRIQDAREAWLHSLELDPTNDKLIERFRSRGFGDPTMEERVRQAKSRVSEHSPPPQTMP